MIRSSLPPHRADLAQVKRLLDTANESADPVDLQVALQAAIRNRHIAVTKFLLAHKPADERLEITTQLVAIEAGKDYFELLYEVDPRVLDHQLGHLGDPLALAALGNDHDLVKWFLEKGVDPEEIEFMHRPLLKFRKGTSICSKSTMKLLRGKRKRWSLC